MLEWQSAILQDIREETEQTSTFVLEIENTKDFKFIPGQFITLDLPIHEKKNKRLRSYSIASAPDGTNRIELVIVKIPDGLGTGFLFDEKEFYIGEKLAFRGPLGNFILPEDLSRPHFFVCTGTGIAPFRSMIHHIRNEKISYEEIYLIFGTRTHKDLLYLEEMNSLMRSMKNFHYIPVLSREDWDGKNGYVHDAYKELCKGKENAHFYLCGWRNMIDQAREELAGLNYPKSQIHFELYG